MAGFLDAAAMFLLLVPFRCRNCRLRFYRPWFLAGRAMPVIAVRHTVPLSVMIPLPIEISAGEPAAMETSCPPPRIILLLDDDRASRKLLCRLLGREGYQVREAHDPGDAMAALRNAQMDLAIVNLGVCEEGEKAVHEALQSAQPELMVVVLSETQDLAETSEKLMILPKPSRVFAVVESVRQLMSQDRQPGNYAHESR